MYKLQKKRRKVVGTFDCKSTQKAKVFNYANTLANPKNYDGFYLEYLETSPLRYTGEMQDLV